MKPKEPIEALSEQLRHLKQRAKEIYKEAHSLDSKRFSGVLANRATVSFDEDSVLFTGWEPWQYGNYLEDEFPLSWLYTDWRKEVVAEKDAREREEQAEREAERKRKTRLEYKMYQELKRKFEEVKEGKDG